MKRLLLIYKMCDWLDYSIEIHYCDKFMYFKIEELGVESPIYLSKDHSPEISIELAEEVLAEHMRKHKPDHMTTEMLAVPRNDKIKI